MPTQNQILRTAANAIADEVKKDKALKGFDPLSLITLLLSLLPALAKCFNPDPAPAPAATVGAGVKKYVVQQYHPETGKYDSPLMSRVRFQVALKAADLHRVTTRAQRDVIAARTLDRLRTQDDAAVGSVMLACYKS